MTFFNRVKFTSSTSGTASFGIGAAFTGFRTPGGAGVTDGTAVSYTAQSADLTQWETGHGVYHTAGPTVSRDTVLENSNSNTSPVTFTNPPSVWFDFLAQDIANLIAGTTAVTKTSNYAVLAADSGVSFDNIGAVAEVDFTLPTAVRGLKYSFSVVAAQIVKVIAGASTIINIGGNASAAAGNVSAFVAGTSVTLYAVSGTQWIALNAVGSWQVT